MNPPTKITCTLPFGRSGIVRDASEIQESEPGRVPRVARLLALAIRLETLVAEGVVKDYAEIARLGYVSRARVTQILNLRNLAADLQEEILFLPEQRSGRDPITERSLRRLAAEPDWRVQRRRWRRLKKSVSNR